METKILLVEDNVTTRELLNTILSLEGFVVVAEAYPESLDAVLSRIREEEPQLILLDFHIGSFNGLDLLSMVRQDAELHDLPIIMTSGADVFEDCQRAGANSFVMKPYSIDQLMRAIREVLPKGQDPR